MKKIFKPLIFGFIIVWIFASSIAVFFIFSRSNRSEVSISERNSRIKKKSPVNLESAELNILPKNFQEDTSQKSFIYPEYSIRDPFRQFFPSTNTQQKIQTSRAETKQPSIFLTGIIWDDKNPIAIMADSESNSYIVRSGEKIRETRIVRIQPQSVTIESSGKVQELVLWPEKL